MMASRTPRQTVTDGAGKALFWVVSVVLWCLVNVAVTVGLFAVLFVMFANANFEGFFVEVGNLANHYLAAPPAARLDFEQLVALAFLGKFIIVCLCRLSALRGGLFSTDKAVSHG